MEDADRKTALRAIPYGIYVMTAKGPDGDLHASTVNWVTQTAFVPPLVAIGVKVDSGIYAATRASGRFVLNMLGKGQQGVAFTFFKQAKDEGGLISGEPYHAGENGAPVLDNAFVAVECHVVQVVEIGDHHVILGQVDKAHVQHAPEGRPDAAILEMRDLGDHIFYGG